MILENALAKKVKFNPNGKGKTRSDLVPRFSEAISGGIGSPPCTAPETDTSPSSPHNTDGDHPAVAPPIQSMNQFGLSYII